MATQVYGQDRDPPTPRGTRLLQFGCDQASLEALGRGRALAAGGVTFEPLVLRAEVASGEDGIYLAIVVAVPGLDPWGALKLIGEAGILDGGGGMWHATAVSAALRPPTAALPRARLGSRADVLKYAGADGQVRFGLLVNDLVLVPGSPAGAAVQRRAYLFPDFVTRRLRAENRRLREEAQRLRAEVRALEGDFDSVLSVACPGPEPAAAPGAPGPAARDVLGEAAGAIAAEARQRKAPELRTLRQAVAALLADVDARLADAESCAVCLAAAADTTFHPCGHECCCGPCAAALPQKLCPLCRAPIQRSSRRADPAKSGPAAQAGSAAAAGPERLSNSD